MKNAHPKFLTRFNAHPRPLIMCTDEERKTKSEFADECDINLIMARYRKTGQLPVNAKAASLRYGDFSQVPDFMQMQDKILAAHELFEALPATVRKQFDNNPGEFIAAAHTKEGRELLVKFGLGADTASPASSEPAGGQPVPDSPKRAPKAKADAIKTEPVKDSE